MPKVILVEDDQLMLSLLKTLLTMEGFEVITSNVDDGDKIVEAILGENPELLLLDFYLVGCNGLDILRKLRLVTKSKPVIIMTSGMDKRMECLEAGANDFLLKPYMPDDLLGMIRRHLKSSV